MKNTGKNQTFLNFKFFIYTIIGFIIGAMLDGFKGGLFFAATGIVVSYIDILSSRTRDLEYELEELKNDLSYSFEMDQEDIAEEEPYPPPDIPEDMPFEPPADETEKEDVSPPHSFEPAAEPAAARIKADDADTEWIKVSPDPGKSAAGANNLNRIPDQVKRFFTQGNVVVKVGVIILFFGFGFLLKYASDHSLLPIELRLIFAALAGIALLVSGYRLRTRQPAYAKIIQGAGIGILYLSVFAAAKLYAILPMGLAFFILVGLVVFSGILAILQDAKYLAVFGIIGGFLSPVIMSTGTGSHVALFTYYGLLNFGIFIIAWFKSWRLLNWLGFVFTFVIASLWGYKYYRPRYFSTTEPFLIVHFLFYSAISLIFAFKQPVKLKGYIDGTLVFGLPVITFGLQSALVKDFEFGMAFSALAWGGYYILLCTALWNRKIDGMKMLVESFLSLGVIFLSLAVPFAFDADWTSGIWAMEGVAVFWVGLRQNRTLARYFGLLLQLAAALSFVETASNAHRTIPIVNGIFLSCFFISVAGMLTHYFLNVYGWPKRVAENPGNSFKKNNLFLIPLVWGFLWWFSGGIFEIHEYVPDTYLWQAVIGFTSASCLMMFWLGYKFNWAGMDYPSAILPFVLFAIVMISIADKISSIFYHPLSNYYWISYIGAISIAYYTLFRYSRERNKNLIHASHCFLFYTILLLVTWESSVLTREITPVKSIWPSILWGLIPGIIVLFMIKDKIRLFKLVRQFESRITGDGLLPVIVWLGTWTAIMFTRPGNPDPLPYLPVVNPLSLVQIFSIMMIIKWSLDLKRYNREYILITVQVTQYLCAALIFLWLNTIIARSVHYWTLTPYHPDNMAKSVYFQASISILWTVISLGAMVFANKRHLRHIWFTGACLLAVVVAKLFLIDLAKIGTVARIISFLVVGALMLVIGYYSPLPPRKKEAGQ